MRRLVLALLSLSLVTAGMSLTAPPAAGAPPRFAHLRPGGLPGLTESVPVNVVLVGFDRDHVSRRKLRAGLPDGV